MSLFSGVAQQAPTYVTSSSETPQWMQDAIYRQVQMASNVANLPFQQFALPRVAELSPLQQQAYQAVVGNQGAWSPAMQQAQYGVAGLTGAGTAQNLAVAQNPYLSPQSVASNMQAAEGLFGQAAGMDIMGAAQPYMQRAAGADVVGAAQPYLQQAGQTTAQALADRALTAAQPYLQQAGQTAASQVGQYMSPYQQGVLDVIARQGARNLREQLLPQVSDAFIKAGQFGSSRMGEFGARAIRDTQEAILAQQAQAAQQGYGQAMSAAQADLARQAGLAGTVGSISGADLSRILQGGGQYANLGQTAGQLTGQQAQAMANLGQTAGQLTGQQAQTLANIAQQRTAAGAQQQQLGLGAAQAVQGATAADYQRQLGALAQLSDMARQEQAMRTSDVAALESAGLSQQAQQQRQLDAALAQFQEQQMYPRQQLDWLSTQIRGMAPITPTTQTQQGYQTQFAPSALSQLASGIYAARGLNALG